MLQISHTSGQGQNIAALHRYLSLDQGDKIQAEYIWIGGIYYRFCII